MCTLLEKLCVAMQLWRKGEDQIDGLTPKHLWKHMSKKPPGPKQPDAKRAPPPRIKCAAIVEVARLVKRHGPHMRQLLKVRERKSRRAAVTAALSLSPKWKVSASCCSSKSFSASVPWQRR